MFKVTFCAAAAVLGGLVGASAPAEWRSDSSRYVRVAELFDNGQSAAMALVYRPYQRGD
jgi:hypothetical protein